MSTVDLMLLGALIEKSMSAYEIKKNMESRNINAWVKISSPAIYKNLVTLRKKGYLDERIVKTQERPEKKIYSINESGRSYFFNMMNEYSNKPGKVYIDFIAFIANLSKIGPKEGLKMMINLKANLLKERVYIQKNIAEKKEFVPFYAISILELYDKMYAMFLEWTEKIMQDFIKNDD